MGKNAEAWKTEAKRRQKAKADAIADRQRQASLLAQEARAVCDRILAESLDGGPVDPVTRAWAAERVARRYSLRQGAMQW